MMGRKICFYGEIWLIIPKLSLLQCYPFVSGVSIYYICFSVGTSKNATFEARIDRGNLLDGVNEFTFGVSYDYIGAYVS